MALLQRIQHSSGVVTYRSPQLHALGVIHAFSTRIGGVSKPPFDSLHLSPLQPTPETEENDRRFTAAIGAEHHTRVPTRQVHGCTVHVPPPGTQPTAPVEADALVTNDPSHLLSVRTADCVPILLASDDGRVVAAVHAGWRGVITCVLPQAVHTMRERFNIPPNRIVAAVGPCITQPHFEVGEEVAIAFTASGMAHLIDRSLGPKPHISLPAAVLCQLDRVGVPLPGVDITDRCTFHHAAEFFSHRRDADRSGRMASVIAPRK